MYLSRDINVGKVQPRGIDVKKAAQLRQKPREPTPPRGLVLFASGRNEEV
jgi:hypothetical protein